MTSNNKNILVFGPTGGVGSAAANEAHRRGAHVWLAMRDPQKPLADIREDDRFTRIQADLSKPETLEHAVQQSGAKIAFVYCLIQSPDQMRGSFSALKRAGISYIVLLSSFKVQGTSPAEVSNTEDFIGKAHAHIEMALGESGIPHAAVRPAYFNTNVLWNKEGIKKGEVEILLPGVKFDYLSPTDIGVVCGALLAEEKFRTEKPVFLCGPELLSQHEAYAIIGRVLGQEVKVKEIDEKTWREKLGHMPKPILDSLSNGLKESSEGVDAYGNIYHEGVENIRKYTEREPTTLAKWVEENKGVFA